MAKHPPGRRAARAFEAFTGSAPRQVRRAALDSHDVDGWRLGKTVGVAYEAVRDGKRERYFHEFKRTAAPDLVVRDDGRQLYFAGGSYKVASRGIEDMPDLFMVNPLPRRRKAPGSTKRKPAAMARSARAPRRRRRSTRQVAVFNTNPRRRRRAAPRRRAFARNPLPPRRRRRRALTSYRRNPVRALRRRRTYKRNPIGGLSLKNFIIPAMGVGGGAVLAEIGMGYLPIPAGLKQGVARHVTKGVVGIAGGMIVSKVFKMKRLGNAIALGAVVIATHDAIKEAIAQRMPSIQMGMYRAPIRSSFAGMGYANPGQVIPQLGQYVQPIASSFEGAGAGTNGGGGEMDFAA